MTGSDCIRWLSIGQKLFVFLNLGQEAIYSSSEPYTMKAVQFAQTFLACLKSR